MTTPGKGGRPKKPNHLRSVEGDRAGRRNDAEPVPGQSGVVMPSWLSPTAKRIWQRLAPDLKAKGVLTAWDVEAFAAFCDAAANHRLAAREVNATGLLVEGYRGVTVKNPAAQLVRDYADIMLKVGARFGLSPTDRAGLKIEKEPTGDGAERLLS